MIGRDTVIPESAGPWTSAFREVSDEETSGTSVEPSLGFQNGRGPCLWWTFLDLEDLMGFARCLAMSNGTPDTRGWMFGERLV